MKEFEIVVNEETEIISVNDFFTFSIKYAEFNLQMQQNSD